MVELKKWLSAICSLNVRILLLCKQIKWNRIWIARKAHGDLLWIESPLTQIDKRGPLSLYSATENVYARFTFTRSSNLGKIWFYQGYLWMPNKKIRDYSSTSDNKWFKWKSMQNSTSLWLSRKPDRAKIERKGSLWEPKKLRKVTVA